MDNAGFLPFVRISCCIAARDEDQLRRVYREALDGGVSLAVLRESVLQSYLFAGYPAAINALIALNDIAGEEQDLSDPFLREQTTSYEAWQARGEELCKKIYGSQYEKLIQNMKRIHPDLSDWMIWEGYGKVLSRPFLSPVVRELMIVAMTAVLQAERQFYSHIRGALHVGADAETLQTVFIETKSFLAPEIFEKYQVILNRILKPQMETDEHR